MSDFYNTLHHNAVKHAVDKNRERLKRIKSLSKHSEEQKTTTKNTVSVGKNVVDRYLAARKNGNVDTVNSAVVLGKSIVAGLLAGKRSYKNG